MTAIQNFLAPRWNELTHLPGGIVGTIKDVTGIIPAVAAPLLKAIGSWFLDQKGSTYGALKIVDFYGELHSAQVLKRPLLGVLKTINPNISNELVFKNDNDNDNIVNVSACVILTHLPLFLTKKIPLVGRAVAILTTPLVPIGAAIDGATACALSVAAIAFTIFSVPFPKLQGFAEKVNTAALFQLQFTSALHWSSELFFSAFAKPSS